MENKELIEKCLKINEDLYKDAKQPLRSHGPDHHMRVCNNSLLLASKIEKNSDIIIDKDVLVSAALFHDLAAYYPEEVGDNYHEYDFVLAEEALKSLKFPDNKLKIVIDAIKNHGSDKKYKNNNEAIEVTILRDADKLDVFGSIGVSRIIMVRTLKGDTMKDIVDDFYLGGHLKRKYDSISTSEAKELCKNDYEYSLNFFKKLSQCIT